MRACVRVYVTSLKDDRNELSFLANANQQFLFLNRCRAAPFKFILQVGKHFSKRLPRDCCCLLSYTHSIHAGRQAETIHRRSQRHHHTPADTATGSLCSRSTRFLHSFGFFFHSLSLLFRPFLCMGVFYIVSDYVETYFTAAQAQFLPPYSPLLLQQLVCAVTHFVCTIYVSSKWIRNVPRFAQT